MGGLKGGILISQIRSTEFNPNREIPIIMVWQRYERETINFLDANTIKCDHITEF